ncbi:MAG: maltotriose-and DNA-dependent transcriptional regulator MalT [Frankiales bacterium]|nr:maltotriose-and DNA-dependent transcriptional regulator MalT [Frankiales bacterium]
MGANAPPERMRPMLVRPRLIERFGARWAHRLMIVHAGAGTGKSAVMGQVVRQGLLDGVGQDLVVTTTPADRTWEGLAATLAGALGTNGLPDSLSTAAGWARTAFSGGATCLWIDDAHHLSDGETSRELLDLLIRSLPDNGHLVIVGRRPPRTPLERHRLLGDIREVTEDELLLTDDERRQIAGLWSVDPTVLEHSGGWPAIARLLADDRDPTSFIEEEVLAGATSALRARLAAAALLHEVDDGLLDALVGPCHADERDALASLPCVRATAAGLLVDDVWRSWAPRQLDDAEHRRLLRAAGAILHGSGRPEAAVERLLEADDRPGLRLVLRQLCDSAAPPIAAETLASWLVRLPPDVRASREARLAEAVATKAEATDPDRAESLLLASVDEMRRADDRSGEVAALVHLLHLAVWRDDLAGHATVVVRLHELAQFGHESARSLVELAMGYRARGRGEIEAAARHYDAIDESSLGEAWVAVVHLLRADVALAAGDAASAASLLESASHAGSEYAQLSGTIKAFLLWHRGDAVGFAAHAPSWEADLRRLGRGESLQAASATIAAFWGYQGDVERFTAARRSLAPQGTFNASAGRTAAVHALEHILAGDEPAAAAALRADLEHFPLSDLGNVNHRAVTLALSYVLCPEVRATWDEAPITPLHRPALDQARALVAVRSGGGESISPAALPDPSRLAVHLPLPWALELTAHATAGGLTGALTTLDRLAAESGWTLPRSVTQPARLGPRRSAATQLHRRPSVHIDVLGRVAVAPTALVEAESPRRARVRHLLLLLALRRTVETDAAMALLWPDLPPAAAANNLRVTLSYTVRTLEPHRANDVPPLWVQRIGDRLVLATEPGLSVDLWEFEARVADAVHHDHAGRAAAALAAYSAALDLYGGDLGGGDRPDWAEPAREHLRARCTAATLRAGELRLAAGEADEAAALGEAVLALDPWSEDSYRLVIAAHLSLGRQAAAAGVLRRCRAALAELGITPDPRTDALARHLPRTTGTSRRG